MKQVNEVINGVQSRLSLTLKLAAIGAVILILLIPKSRIVSLIDERESNRATAEQEVGEMWGGMQVLSGPVLLVPYRHYETRNGETLERKRYAKFLPAQLSIEGNLNSDRLYRSIYELIVYQSDILVSGLMRRPDFNKLDIDLAEVLWDEAVLQISVSDIRGIKESVVLKWGDQELDFESGLSNRDVFSNGLKTGVQVPEADKPLRFSFGLKLNGSKSLSFLPMGKDTKVKLKSDWPAPSFFGNYLPANRLVDSNGFEADWSILSLNRDFPQAWTEANYQLEEAAFGVTLFQPVSAYQRSNRSAKYSLLVIFLTFLVFFIIENLTGSMIHPIQYGMIGLALILFYTLLLSLAEYMFFYQAYLIAALMIVLTIGMYSGAVFQSWKRAFIIMAITTILYIFIYVIIESAQYSLLIGSFGLWLTLSAAMYFTRKMKWYKPKSIAPKEVSVNNSIT